MAYPESPLALVVAMASDKDHIAFAKEFLSGMVPWYDFAYFLKFPSFSARICIPKFVLLKFIIYLSFGCKVQI